MGQVFGQGGSRLPFVARYTYGVGHVLNDLCAAMWFSYLLVYFHSVLQFSNIMAGYVMLIGQVSDALCTPLVGYESDNTGDRCRYGKRKSWHLIGTVCVATTFVFIFNPPIGGEMADDWAKLIYYVPFVIIFQFGWASTQISHLALIPELTGCESERVGLNAIRYSFTVMSSVCVYGLTWFLLSQSNSVISTASPPTDDIAAGTATTLANNVPEFRILSITVVGVGLVFSAIFHIGTKEKCLDNDCLNSPGTKRRRKRKASIIPMTWRDWLKEVQFYQVALLYMCSRLMVNISQVYIPMYVTETLELDKESIAIVPLVIYISGYFSTFLMKLVNKVLGRKMTFFLGACIFLGGCIWLWGDNIGMQVYGASVLLGAGGSTVLVSSLSVTADLIGDNTESGAFVFGAMSFTDKLSNGAAVLIIQYFQPCLNNCPACHTFYQDVVVFVPGCAGILALIALATLAPKQIGKRSRNLEVPLSDDSMVSDSAEDSVAETTIPDAITCCKDREAERLLNNAATLQNGNANHVSTTPYGAIQQQSPKKV